MTTAEKARLRDLLITEAAGLADMVAVGRFLDYERLVGVAFWAKGSKREGRQGVIFDWEDRPSAQMLANVMKYLWSYTPRIPHEQVLEAREWPFDEALENMNSSKQGGVDDGHLTVIVGNEVPAELAK